MVRDFQADIKITANEDTFKPVQIIPFYDKDKIIAEHLETLINFILSKDEDEMETLRFIK
jgi:hypothetical protein